MEVKEAKGQLQEMQEDNDRGRGGYYQFVYTLQDRGRASIQDKLKEFHRNVEDLQEQFKEAMEDFFEDVNDEPPAAVAGSTAKAAAKAPKAGPAAAKSGGPTKEAVSPRPETPVATPRCAPGWRWRSRPLSVARTEARPWATAGR